MNLYRVTTHTGEGGDKREHDFLVRNVRSEAGAIKKAMDFLKKWYPEDYQAALRDPSSVYAFGSREVVEL